MSKPILSESAQKFWDAVTRQLQKTAGRELRRHLKACRTLTPILYFIFDLFSIPSLIPNHSQTNESSRTHVPKTLNSSELRSIIPLIVQFQHLTSLSFDCTNLDDVGVGLMIEVVKSSKDLKTLKLSYNLIHDAGALALADAMKDNLSIRDLYLSENKIEIAGCLALAKAFAVNKTLRSCNLDRNPGMANAQVIQSFAYASLSRGNPMDISSSVSAAVVELGPLSKAWSVLQEQLVGYDACNCILVNEWSNMLACGLPLLQSALCKRTVLLFILTTNASSSTAMRDLVAWIDDIALLNSQEPSNALIIVLRSPLLSDVQCSHQLKGPFVEALSFSDSPILTVNQLSAIAAALQAETASAEKSCIFHSSAAILHLPEWKLGPHVDSLSQQLSFLRSLNLSSSNLTTFPSGIESMKHLRFLDLSSNNIKILPDHFGKLCSLVECNLARNPLALLPPSILNHCRLECLNLEACNFRAFPAVPVHLPNLKKLILRGNELTCLPTTFTTLATLTYLDLSQNSISQLPSDFGKLFRLEYLDISANTSLDSLPDSCQELKRLIAFQCSDTALIGVVKELLEGKSGFALLEAVLLGHQGGERIFRTKLMLVGEGEAGKTSLRLALSTFSEQAQEIRAGMFYTVLASVELSLVGSLLTITELPAAKTNAKKTYNCNEETWKFTLNKLDLLLSLPGRVERKLRFATVEAAKRWYDVLEFIRKPSRTIGATVEYVSLSSSIRNFQHLSEEFLVNRRGSPDANLELTLWDLGGQEEYWWGHRLYLERRCVYVVVWDVLAQHALTKLVQWLLRIANFALKSPTESVAPNEIYMGFLIVANKTEDLSDEKRADLLESARCAVDDVFHHRCGIRFEYAAISIHGANGAFGIGEVREQVFNIASVMSHMGEVSPWWLRKCELVIDSLRNAERAQPILMISKSELLREINSYSWKECKHDAPIDMTLLERALPVLRAWSKVLASTELGDFVVIDPAQMVEQVIGKLLKRSSRASINPSPSASSQSLYRLNQAHESSHVITAMHLQNILALSAKESSKFHALVNTLVKLDLLIPITFKDDLHLQPSYGESMVDTKSQFILISQIPRSLDPTSWLDPSKPHMKYVFSYQFNLTRPAGGLRRPFIPQDLYSRLLAALCHLKVRDTPCRIQPSTNCFVINTPVGLSVLLELIMDRGALSVTAESQLHVFKDGMDISAALEDILDLVRGVLGADKLLSIKERIRCYSSRTNCNGRGLFHVTEILPFAHNNGILRCSSCKVDRFARDILWHFEWNLLLTGGAVLSEPVTPILHCLRKKFAHLERGDPASVTTPVETVAPSSSDAVSASENWLVEHYDTTEAGGRRVSFSEACSKLRKDLQLLHDAIGLSGNSGTIILTPDARRRLEDLPVHLGFVYNRNFKVSPATEEAEEDIVDTTKSIRDIATKLEDHRLTQETVLDVLQNVEELIRKIAKAQRGPDF